MRRRCLAYSLPAAVGLPPRPARRRRRRRQRIERRDGRARGRARRAPSATEPRRSYAAAINQAVAQTPGDAVLLLNADCVLDDGFLAAAPPRLEAERASARWRRSCSEPPGRRSRDRRGRDGRRPPAQERTRRATAARRHRSRAPAAAFGADGAAALYRRRRCGLRARGPSGSCWTRIWSCGHPTPTSRGARSCSAGLRLRAGGGGDPHPHLQPVDASADARARAADAVPQPLSDDRQERDAPRAQRDGALIAGYELLALGHVLLRERHLLGGYRDA